MCEVVLEEHNWFTEDAKKICTILKAILFLMTFLQYGYVHMCKRMKRNKLILLF